MHELSDQDLIQAAFIRGGTSKAIFFRRDRLPAERDAWVPIMLAAMGSPDPNGRQLNGMGGGLSSLSKICVVERSQRPGVDVDYTFGQVSIKEPGVRFTGNCGNISSAVGPYAVDEGLVSGSDGMRCLTLFNTNTSKIVRATFLVRGGKAAVSGDLSVPGVSGTGSPVQLEFLEPGGAVTGELFPTGSKLDVLVIPGLGNVRVSIVDSANLCCFAIAEDMGLAGTEMPAWLDAAAAVHDAVATMKAQTEAMIATRIQREGWRPVVSLLGFVSPPADAPTLSGQPVLSSDAELTARMFSSGQPHRALPLTSALCMSVAAKIPGTTVNSMARRNVGDANIRIATPSGVLTLTSSMTQEGDSWIPQSASVYRTQRRLFDGAVHVPRIGSANMAMAAE